MGKSVNGYGIFGYILAVIGAALLAASIGTGAWKTPFGISDIVSLSFSQTTGLFASTSWDVNAIGITALSTRVILALSCLLIAIGLIVGLAALCGSGEITAHGAINIIGSIFTFVGCGVYTALTILVDNYMNGAPAAGDFGYSFYLCWVSGFVLFVAGLFELKGKKEVTEQRQVHPATMQAQMVWATSAQPQRAPVAQPGQHQLSMIRA